MILATSCYKSCPSILIVFLWILTTGNSKLFDVVLTELLTGGFGFQARLTHRSTGHSPTRFEDHQGECFRRVSAVFRLVTISGMLFYAHVFRILESRSDLHWFKRGLRFLLCWCWGVCGFLSRRSALNSLMCLLNLDMMSLTLVLRRREHLILEPFPDRSSSFLELFSASALCVATKRPFNQLEPHYESSFKDSGNC